MQMFLLLFCVYGDDWNLKQKAKLYTENLSAKLQNSNQNSTFSWVSLIGLWTTRSRSYAFRLAWIYILLRADSGPPRMNTIASRDQFKPIRIGENLLVNYYGGISMTKFNNQELISNYPNCMDMHQSKAE